MAQKKEEQKAREELRTLMEYLNRKESEGGIPNQLIPKSHRNLATVDDFAVTFDAFYDAIKDTIYDTYRNYREKATLVFYSLFVLRFVLQRINK